MSRLATTPPKVIKRSKSHLSAFASEDEDYMKSWFINFIKSPF